MDGAVGTRTLIRCSATKPVSQLPLADAGNGHPDATRPEARAMCSPPLLATLLSAEGRSRRHFVRKRRGDSDARSSIRIPRAASACPARHAGTLEQLSSASVHLVHRPSAPSPELAAPPQACPAGRQARRRPRRSGAHAPCARMSMPAQRSRSLQQIGVIAPSSLRVWAAAADRSGVVCGRQAAACILQPRLLPPATGVFCVRARPRGAPCTTTSAEHPDPGERVCGNLRPDSYSAAKFMSWRPHARR